MMSPRSPTFSFRRSLESGHESRLRVGGTTNLSTRFTCKLVPAQVKFIEFRKGSQLLRDATCNQQVEKWTLLAHADMLF